MSIKTLFTGALLAAAVSATAADYKIDPEHSFVQFKIKHLGVSYLVANFNEVKGTLSFDANKVEASNIAINVATTSLDTNYKIRDGHLGKDTIINYGKFPEATFVSTSYQGDADKGLVTGTLTINGVSKEVSLEVTRIGEGNDPWGGYRVGFNGELVIDRREFSSTENFGPDSWNVMIEVNVEAIKL